MSAVRVTVAAVRVLITGASGFVGGWLARACAARGDQVLGVSRSGRLEAGLGDTLAADLTDAVALREAIRSLAPEVVFHLAALSHVGRSWEDPQRTLALNTATAAGLLEALRLHAPGARLVWVSSGEVYRAGTQLPLVEDDEVLPSSPYAVSKLAGEMLASLYSRTHGIDLVIARAFAHAGPGQRPIFLLSSICRQAALARLSGARSLTITTGNPQTRRDLTDVRDVVRAYLLLAERTLPAGVYNVCSGVSSSTAQRVAAVAAALAPLTVEHAVDPALVRAHEAPVITGSHARLREAGGWCPQIPLQQTIADTISWWERQLRE